MKRLIQYFCVLLAVVLVMAVPARAEAANTRESAYFSAYDSFLWKTSGTTFQVWYDVIGNGTMDKLGVSCIKVQRSTDGQNWTTVKTYLSSNYPDMICENTFSHGGYVTYTGSIGYYYRAYVTFYATKGTGTGLRYDYAETIKY